MVLQPSEAPARPGSGARLWPSPGPSLHAPTSYEVPPSFDQGVEVRWPLEQGAVTASQTEEACSVFSEIWIHAIY